ncbi:MAG TPA: cytochrome c [Thermoanaerobaculia bacterium]|nr:cytochrome c [Thermoanaerobaculia bacterium]
MEAALLAGVLSLVPALSALHRPAPGQGEPAGTGKAERIALGRLSYRIHCASCHGESGRGDGPLAEDLKVRPSDLTHLRKGRFLQTEIRDAIDGRRKVRGHGPADMPVWGATFQDRGRDTPQEREVREKILDLVAYIESIQADS